MCVVMLTEVLGDLHSSGWWRLTVVWRQPPDWSGTKSFDSAVTTQREEEAEQTRERRNRISGGGLLGGSDVLGGQEGRGRGYIVTSIHHDTARNREVSWGHDRTCRQAALRVRSRSGEFRITWSTIVWVQHTWSGHVILWELRKHEKIEEKKKELRLSTNT